MDIYGIKTALLLKHCDALVYVGLELETVLSSFCQNRIPNVIYASGIIFSNKTGFEQLEKKTGFQHISRLLQFWYSLSLTVSLRKEEEMYKVSDVYTW